jgi:nucleoid DNA-binding protein
MDEREKQFRIRLEEIQNFLAEIRKIEADEFGTFYYLTQEQKQTMMDYSKELETIPYSVVKNFTTSTKSLYDRVECRVSNVFIHTLESLDPYPQMVLDFYNHVTDSVHEFLDGEARDGSDGEFEDWQNRFNVTISMNGKSVVLPIDAKLIDNLTDLIAYDLLQQI